MGMMQELQDGETVVRCPFCSYAEVRDFHGEGQINFCFCKGEDCQKVSCRLCHNECIAVGDLDHDDYEANYNAAAESMEQHFVCAEKDAQWGCMTREMESILSSSRACPGCGLAGMKDDACTHMTCTKCSTEWCYVCGEDSASCDKASTSTGLNAHNVDWNTNPQRCPMYLMEIDDVDPRWPATDEECLEYMHKQRVTHLLREFYDKHGQDRYRQMVTVYPKYRDACAYSEAAILGFDTTIPLIARGEDADED